MKVLVLIISTLLISSALCHIELEFLSNMYSFDRYKSEYNKDYSSREEHEIRERIFNENLAKIEKVNNDPTSTWVAGINHLTDRTNEELKQLTGYNRDMSFNSKGFNYQIDPINLTVKEYPEKVDWRERGVVASVKNQKSCGSCWTFSVGAVLESHVAIASGKLLDVSEQQLVSCVENPKKCGGTGGCHGATQEIGFQYIVDNGITTEADYPYTATETKCEESQTKHTVAKIDGFVQLPINDYNSLMDTLTNIGPVAISVDATDFHLYKSGVFNGINGTCGSTINHAVVAVGYGKDEKHGNYWIVRNSWGPQYGEEGYIRVGREKDASEVKCETDKHPEQGSGCEGGPTEVLVCGVCGILADSSYPTRARLA